MAQSHGDVLGPLELTPTGTLSAVKQRWREAALVTTHTGLVQTGKGPSPLPVDNSVFLQVGGNLCAQI